MLFSALISFVPSSIHAQTLSIRHLLAQDFVERDSNIRILGLRRPEMTIFSYWFMSLNWNAMVVDLHMENAPDGDFDEVGRLVSEALHRHADELIAGTVDLAERTFTSAELAALRLPFSTPALTSATDKLKPFYRKNGLYMMTWAHEIGRDAFAHNEAYFLKRGSPDYRDPAPQGVTK